MGKWLKIVCNDIIPNLVQNLNTYANYKSLSNDILEEEPVLFSQKLEGIVS
jgi:hypothetical protein